MLRFTDEQSAEYQARNATRNIPRKAVVPPVTQKESQLIPLQPQGKQNAPQGKYKNNKVTIEGILFDSTKEANRWLQLKALFMSGAISNLQRQSVFVLAPSVVLDGRKKPAIRYVADFTYSKGGKDIVEDVKSSATKKLPAYRLKKHLMMSVHGLSVSEI